tara:strand:+ start:42 stop:611 length:570 start_codon:yes stop_codon:yes gene_type:complete
MTVIEQALDFKIKCPVDFSKFNWKEIFGTVKATDGLKRPQTLGLRTEIQEIATAKHSGGQFKYVGMREDGKDYISSSGDHWEDKSSVGLFKGILSGKSLQTKEIILKNYRGNNTGPLKRTFDYILLKDTGSMSVAWATWEAASKNAVITDATIKCKFYAHELNFIEINVEPEKKDDFSKSLEILIEQLV